MSRICSENECKREVFENDKCIFHCEKDDWYDENSDGDRDWNRSEEERKEFWEIIRQHEEKFCTEVKFSRIIFPGLFRKDMIFDNDYKKSFFTDFKKSMKKKVVFQNCIFLDSIHYLVSNIEFSDCTFSQSVSFYCDYSYSESLALKNCSKFDGECKIVNIIQGTVVNEEAVNISINKCVFKFDVKIENLWFRKCSIDDTSFEKSLKLNDCLIEKIDILNTECSNIISIKESDISKKFILSNDESDKDKKKINKFVFENNKFCKKSDIYFKHVELGFLSFKNISNYSEYINFFDTKIIKELEFNNINLSNTEFHNCDFEKIEEKIEIENVSFISNSGFTIFNGVKWGDIAKTYNPSTDRDTFRQLKYVNEKQGNIIEANKFYSAEMEAYKKELKDEKSKHNRQDRVVFWLNEKVSNFSQSWLKPFGWFFMLGFIAFISSNISKILYYLGDTSKITSATFLNTSYHFFKYLNPFNTTAGDWNPIIWLIFKALSVFIIYQFIISLRRQTRR